MGAQKITTALWSCLVVVSLSVDVACSRPEAPALRARVTAGVPVPDDAVVKVLNRYRVPGVSVAVVHEGRVDWAKGYGLRAYGNPEQVDTATLFQAASISKPVSAVVALRMVERGELTLDEDVNRKLNSWKIPSNRFTREQPVTLRRLLSHSAGLNMHGVPEFARGDSLPTLVEILMVRGAELTNRCGLSLNPDPHSVIPEVVISCCNCC